MDLTRKATAWGQGEKDGEFWKRPEEKVEFLSQTEIDTIVLFTEGERKSRVGEGGRGVHGEHLMKIGEKERSGFLFAPNRASSLTERVIGCYGPSCVPPTCMC